MMLVISPMKVNLNVVLVEPEIPHNTGAIGRLCVGLGARLHLIKPFGFRLTDKQLQRCGLDYWAHLDLRVHNTWAAFLETEQPAAMHLLSTRGERSIYACRFAAGCFLVFGSETMGFPAPLYETHRDQLCRIPMPGPHARSINLANAVAVVAYEAYRQMGSGKTSVTSQP
jgi:tRNA (cytidine/uridine-2'-O-)-methyltransferase